MIDSADNPLPAQPTSNWVLIRRMLGLGWHYRWGCVWLLSLQGLLLFSAITTLRLAGYGIDLVRFHSQSTTVKPPSLWLLEPPAHWAPMAQIAMVAGLVLLMEFFRGSLNYTLRGQE